MSRTLRADTFGRCIRRPKYRHRLLAGESRRLVVTDWDDKPISGRNETKKSNPLWR